MSCPKGRALDPCDDRRQARALPPASCRSFPPRPRAWPCLGTWNTCSAHSPAPPSSMQLRSRCRCSTSRIVHVCCRIGRSSWDCMRSRRGGELATQSGGGGDGERLIVGRHAPRAATTCHPTENRLLLCCSKHVVATPSQVCTGSWRPGARTPSQRSLRPRGEKWAGAARCVREKPAPSFASTPS